MEEEKSIVQSFESWEEWIAIFNCLFKDNNKYCLNEV